MDTKNNDAKRADGEATDPKPATATLIVFGKDKGESGKPHASWFGEADAPLAEKAAGLMGMRILRLISDDQRALASQLPAGRVFASGKAFIPFISRKLFDQLEAMGGEVPAHDPAPDQTASSDEPTVVDAVSDSAEAATPTAAPSPWAAITVGSVVLVTEGRPQEGWWEAVVTEVKADDLLVLRWRDFPEDESLIVRNRKQVALLYPTKA
jgi:hypothetical protein